MNHFDLNRSDSDNKKQPIYTVEWFTDIQSADMYRAGESIFVHYNRNCYLLNPTCIGECIGGHGSLCFETSKGLLVLPYKQIVSIIPQVEDK